MWIEDLILKAAEKAAEKGGTSVLDLSKSLGITWMTARRRIGKAVALGYLEIEKISSHLSRVLLTEKGKELVRQKARQWAEVAERLGQ